MSTDFGQAGEELVEPRQAVAARNVEAVLDAAEDLLVRGAPLNFSALATTAGLSRPTVYSHFPDRATLLAAVVERTVSRAVEAIESVQPDDGDPVAALRRVLAAGWEPLARHQALARAVSAEIPHEAVHAIHHRAIALFARLVERGRAGGSFRTDLPAGWLVTASLALIHAAAAAVRSGQMTSPQALDALSPSVVELCVGPGST